MKKKKMVVVVGLLIFVAIVFIMISGFQQNTIYYIEVHELQKDPDRFTKKGIRISGDVLNGTVKKDEINKHLEFVMTDKTGAKMNVVYNGIIPDAFKEDVQVIVEGKYDKSTNTFTAKTLLAKCPSKYEAEVDQKSKK
ncbi:MAG: cytochrome c maturation protein CcmE [Calditerrivibrio sp.]|nr:cytochrome c maturation protein CcmE [Calditerrivibrio sp.]